MPKPRGFARRPVGLCGKRGQRATTCRYCCRFSSLLAREEERPMERVLLGDRGCADHLPGADLGPSEGVEVSFRWGEEGRDIEKSWGSGVRPGHMKSSSGTAVPYPAPTVDRTTPRSALTDPSALESILFSDLRRNSPTLRISPRARHVTDKVNQKD
ncbi:hypothetical protein BC628DRAFT_1104325 [Trametes gibbosa]|nr:hypothetical protein BC628DRAFT_1104325 [Trametes gibbosa]